MKKQMLLGASFIAAAPAMVQFAAAAPPPSPPVSTPYNWTGFYAGGGAGYGWGHSSQSDHGFTLGGSTGATGPTGVTGLADGSYAVSGGVLGGTLGYDWQQSAWVFGIEGDYSWAHISGSSNTCGAGGIPAHACGTTLRSIGTLRGRIGYAMGATGNWLPYVTGGLAVGELNAWDNLTGASGSDFRTGWAMGGGVETALTPNWTFKVEYLHIDLGSRQTFNIVPGVPETVSFSSNLIRAGINFKFR